MNESVESVRAADAIAIARKRAIATLSAFSWSAIAPPFFGWHTG